MITGGDRYLDCQGVYSIAGSLRKQSLKEVNKELRGTGFFDPTISLPKHAAGGDVGILVGIQDVQLDPVLIAVLASVQVPLHRYMGVTDRVCRSSPILHHPHCQQPPVITLHKTVKQGWRTRTRI